MLLWAAAVVLGLAVSLFAMLSAPDFAPVKVVPSSGTISAAVTASPSDEPDPAHRRGLSASTAPPGRN